MSCKNKLLKDKTGRYFEIKKTIVINKNKLK